MFTPTLPSKYISDYLPIVNYSNELKKYLTNSYEIVAILKSNRPKKKSTTESYLCHNPSGPILFSDPV